MPLIESVKNWFKNLKNERLYRRLPADLGVMITVVDKGLAKDQYQSKITDWSPAGVFIALTPPLPLQTILDIEFVIGDQGSSRLKLRGQVVRHLGSDGMGIMFTDFTESGLAILRDFLTKESLS